MKRSGRIQTGRIQITADIQSFHEDMGLRTLVRGSIGIRRAPGSVGHKYLETRSGMPFEISIVKRSVSLEDLRKGGVGSCE